MSKVKIGKDVRCLILLFGMLLIQFCLKFFSKFFCTNIVKNVYDLMIRCAKISTGSIYTGANDNVLISFFPPQSSPSIRAKYRVSQLSSFTEFSSVQQITQILVLY